MKLDEYWVEEYKPLLSYLDCLIEWPKSLIKPDIHKHEEKPKKASVEKAIELKSKHSRG